MRNKKLALVISSVCILTFYQQDEARAENEIIDIKNIKTEEDNIVFSVKNHSLDSIQVRVDVFFLDLENVGSQTIITLEPEEDLLFSFDVHENRSALYPYKTAISVRLDGDSIYIYGPQKKTEHIYILHDPDPRIIDENLVEIYTNIGYISNPNVTKAEEVMEVF